MTQRAEVETTSGNSIYNLIDYLCCQKSSSMVASNYKVGPGIICRIFKYIRIAYEIYAGDSVSESVVTGIVCMYICVTLLCYI